MGVEWERLSVGGAHGQTEALACPDQECPIILGLGLHPRLAQPQSHSETED